jgi:hypothetical protein
MDKHFSPINSTYHPTSCLGTEGNNAQKVLFLYKKRSKQEDSASMLASANPSEEFILYSNGT